MAADEILLRDMQSFLNLGQHVLPTLQQFRLYALAKSPADASTITPMVDGGTVGETWAHIYATFVQYAGVFTGSPRQCLLAGIAANRIQCSFEVLDPVHLVWPTVSGQEGVEQAATIRAQAASLSASISPPPTNIVATASSPDGGAVQEPMLFERTAKSGGATPLLGLLLAAALCGCVLRCAFLSTTEKVRRRKGKKYAKLQSDLAGVPDEEMPAPQLS